MPQAIHHFGHFIVRVFVCSYLFLGTSPGGIAAQVVSIIGTEIGGGWWRVTAWRENWKGGLKRAFSTLGVVWLIVIVGCFVITMYDDHQSLAGRLRVVVKEKDGLKAGLTQRDDYIKRLENIKCPQCKAGVGQLPGTTSLVTIQTLTAEGRLTFDLDPEASLPQPEIPFVPVGSGSNAHLHGAGGDEELTFVSPIVFQRESGGKVVAINTFSLVATSALRGRSVSALDNFNQLLIPAVVVGANSLKHMALYEATITLNGKQIWYYSYELNGADFKSGPTFKLPFQVKH